MDPWVKNPQAEQNPGPFREGDRVRMLWGFTPVEGVIVEDRGNLGVGGRRIYLVLVDLDNGISEPMTLPAGIEDLTLVAKAPPPPRKRRRKEGRDEG
jgi:hypothetical protein